MDPAVLPQITQLTVCLPVCQVTFDTSKHLSDVALKRRQQERLRILELERQREELKRKEKEEEERHKEEERYAEKRDEVICLV